MWHIGFHIEPSAAGVRRPATPLEATTPEVELLETPGEITIEAVEADGELVIDTATQ